MSNLIKAEFIISGNVQGVGFRYFVHTKVHSIGGLTGFVKNQFDGTVLCVCEGNKRNLNDLLQYLKAGPSHVYVDNVKEYYEEAKGEYEDFDVRY